MLNVAADLSALAVQTLRTVGRLVAFEAGPGMHDRSNRRSWGNADSVERRARDRPEGSLPSGTKRVNHYGRMRNDPPDPARGALAEGVPLVTPVSGRGWRPRFRSQRLASLGVRGVVRRVPPTPGVASVLR
jgi:hypothetical protein